MRDSIQTKTSSFKGKKTQKKNDFDTPVDAAGDRESQATDPYSLRHNFTYKYDSEF